MDFMNLAKKGMDAVGVECLNNVRLTKYSTNNLKVVTTTANKAAMTTA